MNLHTILGIIIAVGLIKIIIDSYQNIRQGRYSLDYIAAAAMILSLWSGEFIAGAVIAVMFIGGEALESFASNRAYKSLKKLSDTIPKSCLVKEGENLFDLPIQQVIDGQIILIKANEIIPLDGTIISDKGAILNMANLTGESEPVVLKRGTHVKSGSINIGETLHIKVVGDFSTSAYQKIVGLVEEAKSHPSRTVKLSERANFYFTIIAFVISLTVFLFTHDLSRLLAVLVIATPCPLIIAAPVAFVSGMSRVARAGIILRRPVSFEGIDAATTIFFDKTGTLTLGEPVLDTTNLSDEALSIAASLEIHSLHPRARSIVAEARKRNLNFIISDDVKEEIGRGISGTIDGARYSLMGESLRKNNTEIARFHFRDVLKHGAFDLISRLQKKGIHTAIITGDKTEVAEKVFADANIDIFAEKTPEDKFNLIDQEKEKGGIVVMIGDGLNDAPALARADVGIVFSGTENGASIEAADVAVLGSGLGKLDELFKTSRRTMRVARQSIYGGIALSVIGMIFAAFGFVEPVVGALIQETIDVAVILNALRALS